MSIRKAGAVSDVPAMVTRWAGLPAASAVAVAVVIGLLIAGSVTRFPHWWHVSVHSAGALVSLVMLFLIQHTTNRETNAILLKLDELVAATSGADERVIDAEHKDVPDQEDLEDELHRGDRRPDDD